MHAWPAILLVLLAGCLQSAGPDAEVDSPGEETAIPAAAEQPERSTPTTQEEDSETTPVPTERFVFNGSASMTGTAIWVGDNVISVEPPESFSCQCTFGYRTDLDPSAIHLSIPTDNTEGRTYRWSLTAGDHDWRGYAEAPVEADLSGTEAGWFQDATLWVMPFSHGIPENDVHFEAELVVTGS